MKKGKIWIGTSNVVIPGNKQSFPETFQQSSRLHYYSQLFPTVEINSSFYKVPQAATFLKWSNEVNPGFKFSVKLSREITHIKELRFDENALLKFLDAYQMPVKNKGPLLVQFPGKISLEYYNEAEHILELIRQHSDKDQLQVAVEFRSPTWYTGEAMEMLDAFDAALVLHDMPKSKIFIPNKKTPFIYLRLHGKSGDYRGSCEKEDLEFYANMLKTFSKKGKGAFVYFNNTIGAAFDNAVYLQQLCG